MITMKARHLGLLAFLLSLAAATALFNIWPGLDLAVARWFQTDGRFAGNDWAWSRISYRWFPWLGALLVAWNAFVVIRCLRAAGPRMPIVRSAAMLLLVAVFGVGILVHGVVKEQSGRPRPAQVTEFHGTLAFQPALQVSSACAHNCSFVSGHAAGGFALIALGALGARRMRRRWWLAGVALGTVVGIGRIAQGSHFASDVVFSLLLVWGVTLAVRTLWLWGTLLRRRMHRLLAEFGSLWAGSAAASR
jgi:lipid A 4'-phosphatase